MDVPQPEFESLFSVVLLYNQGYFYRFSPTHEHIRWNMDS